MADKIYYDQVATGTSNTTHLFFNHSEGSNEEYITNLSEAAKLDKDFSLKSIEINPAVDITNADVLILAENSILKIKIGPTEVIKMPLALALSASHEILGSNGGLTSGNTDVAAFVGTPKGYVFDEPISIPAGTAFKVEIVGSTAFATDTNLITSMRGSVSE